MKVLYTFFLCLFLACSSNVTQAQTVYTAKTGTKYHKGSCHYLKHSKFETTLKKAKDAGYEPCSVCKPTRVVTNASESNDGLGIMPKTTKTKSTPTTTETKQATSSQCTGKTKAGKRCKRMTKSVSGRCYQH
jgi:hypothetical protein